MLSGARALLTPAELQGEPMGKRSDFKRRERDFYPTPREALLPLLPHIKGVRRFREPCAGAGDLVSTKQSTALIQHCSIILPIGRVE